MSVLMLMHMYSYGVDDLNLVGTLDALRRTVPDDKMYVFMDAVHHFADMETFFYNYLKKLGSVLPIQVR